MDHNKTAIITGASRGIGQEFSKYFASKNYDLLLLSKNFDTLEASVNELLISYPTCKVMYKAIDIANIDLVSNAISEFYNIHNRIDIVLNNAGYVKRGTSELDQSELIKMINVNLIGAFNIIHSTVPYLKKQKFGHIINISSRNAKTPRSFLGGYAATKAAILAFNESLYKELSEFGIKVTALIPGFVDTHMTKDVNLPRQDLIQTQDFCNFLDLILSLKSNVALKEIAFEATPQIGAYP